MSTRERRVLVSFAMSEAEGVKAALQFALDEMALDKERRERLERSLARVEHRIEHAKKNGTNGH